MNYLYEFIIIIVIINCIYKNVVNHNTTFYWALLEKYTYTPWCVIKCHQFTTHHNIINYLTKIAFFRFVLDGQDIGPGRPVEDPKELVLANGFGPAILANPSARQRLLSRLSRFDLMLGVVRAESFFAFTGDDVQYGIEADRRTKILKTYVKNTYKWAFATPPPVLVRRRYLSLFYSQVPFDRNISDHRKRIHRLGQTGTTSGEHQRRDVGSPVRRPSRGTRHQHGRPTFG